MLCLIAAFAPTPPQLVSQEALCESYATALRQQNKQRLPLPEDAELMAATSL